MEATVLIVDDHPLTRDALATLLRGSEFEVVGEASDGEEAIALAGALEPDLVLLDLSMPGLDGLEAIPLIHERAPETRIVVFSGFARTQMGELALSRKAERYVEKGEPLERVREAILELAA